MKIPCGAVAEMALPLLVVTRDPTRFVESGIGVMVSVYASGHARDPMRNMQS
jgi:hypothetical protein